MQFYMPVGAHALLLNDCLCCLSFCPTAAAVCKLTNVYIYRERDFFFNYCLSCVLWIEYTHCKTKQLRVFMSALQENFGPRHPMHKLLEARAFFFFIKPVTKVSPYVYKGSLSLLPNTTCSGMLLTPAMHSSCEAGFQDETNYTAVLLTLWLTLLFGVDWQSCFWHVLTRPASPLLCL